MVFEVSRNFENSPYDKHFYKRDTSTRPDGATVQIFLQYSVFDSFISTYHCTILDFIICQKKAFYLLFKISKVRVKLGEKWLCVKKTMS